MAFIDNYNFENLKNEAERLVFEELGKQLEAFPENEEICLCNDCVADMATMVLNTVKPLYRYSLLGTLYAAAQVMTDDGYAESIRTAVTHAIKKVQENPSHL